MGRLPIELRHLVSCVVPVYNGERFIDQAIESILAQTYQHLEVIIVDDGSSDGTSAVVQHYGDAVRYIRQGNGGPPSARNTGVRAAAGEFVAFLDSDDRWAPEKIACQLGRFDRNPALGICVAHAQNFWEDELSDERASLRDHPRSRPVPGYVSTTLMARRSVFDSVGMYDTQLQHADDMDWFVRARQAGIEIELVPDVLVFRRMHVNNRSRHRADASIGEHLQILKSSIDRKRRSGTTAVSAEPAADPQRVYAAMESAFERVVAEGPTGGLVTDVLRLGGTPARIRCAGSALAARIMRPFAHLVEGSPSGEPPGLEIDLWDEAEIGVPPQHGHCVPRDALPTTRPEFAASPDDRFAMHTYRRSVTTLDRRQRRMYGWFAGGDLHDLPDLSRPLYAPLLLWHRDCGIQAVHAAAVALDGAGVLFGGPAGCGKTTSALSCVCRGFSYLGDDYVGLEERGDGGFAGHSLYNSAHVDDAHFQHLPDLAPHEVRVSPDTKALVFIAEAFPGRAASTASINVLLLPRITNRSETSVRRASRAQALMRLAPSSMLWLPHMREAGMDAMARFVESVPCYWLEIGGAMDRIAVQVERVLQEVSESCRSA